MPFYGSRLPNYIEAKNEAELKSKLGVVASELGQKLEIINVYKNFNNGKVVAWYFHDTSASPMPRQEEATKKKTVRKKSRKKAE